MRNIVERKKLSEDVYAYDKKGVWITSNKNVSELNYFGKRVDRKNIEGITEIDNNPVVEMLPELIEINDNEHFIDCEGNKLNIMIRGNRENRLFYFRVKDIMDSIRNTAISGNSY